MSDVDKLPHVLTIDQMDELCDEYFVELVHTKEWKIPFSVMRVIERLTEYSNTRLYTQVDTDFCDRLYVHGLCIVNSTGIHAIVTPK